MKEGSWLFAAQPDASHSLNLPISTVVSETIALASEAASPWPVRLTISRILALVVVRAAAGRRGEGTGYG